MRGERGQAAGHGFAENHRHAVAIAVLGDHAGKDEAVLIGEPMGDESVVARAEELDFIFDVQVVNAILESFTEWAVADDVDGEIAAALGENSRGFDEDMKTFDLDESADGGEAERGVGVVEARLEKVDIDPVGLDMNLSCVEAGGEF